MADSKRKKLEALMKALDRKFGVVTRPEFLPPPSSADAAEAMAVSKKNSEIIAGAVLGLHGPPSEGLEASKRLMSFYVDWNEARVANAASLIRALGKDARAAGRIAILQRFLEAFFLRQRNLNLDYIAHLRPAERRQFVSNLEVFDREELAAFLLTCFGHPSFPPSDPICEMAKAQKLVPEKTTKLQMAKKFETLCKDPNELLTVYSHLFSLAREKEAEAVPDEKGSLISKRQPKVTP